MWWHKTCEHAYFLTKLYLAPTCSTKLQVFLDFRHFLLASLRNYVVTLTLTGCSCKMSCQYPRINQSQVYCFVIKLMNTSSHEYKNSSNKHRKEGELEALFHFLGQLNHAEAILPQALCACAGSTQPGSMLQNSILKPLKSHKMAKLGASLPAIHNTAF